MRSTTQRRPTIISNASCTMNCLAPNAKVLNNNFASRALGLWTLGQVDQHVRPSEVVSGEVHAGDGFVLCAAY